MGFRFRRSTRLGPLRFNYRFAGLRLRVRQGGHAIPTEVIERRFKAGLRNFENLYRPLVN